MSEETRTPSLQVSQIGPASLRAFLPEYAPGLILFANIIQTPSSNPHDELDAAILQQIQPSAAERVQQLLQHDCIGDLRPIYHGECTHLQTKPIESVAEMADNIIEKPTPSPPRPPPPQPKSRGDSLYPKHYP
ncbi:hypothetical protein ACTXT7_015383 [Hymenolepis weldensis]